MQFHIFKNIANNTHISHSFSCTISCVSCSPVDPHITHDEAYAHLLCYLRHISIDVFMLLLYSFILIIIIDIMKVFFRLLLFWLDCRWVMCVSLYFVGSNTVCGDASVAFLQRELGILVVIWKLRLICSPSWFQFN